MQKAYFVSKYQTQDIQEKQMQQKISTEVDTETKQQVSNLLEIRTDYQTIFNQKIQEAATIEKQQLKQDIIKSINLHAQTEIWKISDAQKFHANQKYFYDPNANEKHQLGQFKYMHENTNNQRFKIRTKIQASIPMLAPFGQIYTIYDGNDEWFWKQSANAALEASRISYLQNLQNSSKEPVYYGIVRNKDNKIEVDIQYDR